MERSTVIWAAANASIIPMIKSDLPKRDIADRSRKWSGIAYASRCADQVDKQRSARFCSSLRPTSLNFGPLTRRLRHPVVGGLDEMKHRR